MTKKRFLLVEDEFMARVYLARFLASYGECDVAVNGQEAIAACRVALEQGVPYGVIFLDIMMPDLSGHEVLSQLRQMEKERGFTETKVVMTSALNDPANVVSAYYDGGATDFLVKPVNRGKLSDTLKKLGIF